MKDTLEAITNGAEYDSFNCSCVTQIVRFRILLVFGCACTPLTTTICSVVSKYLQSKEINISVATLHVQALISEFEKLCNCSEFDKFWLKAEDVSQKLEVDYIEPRPRKISKRLDDLWQNETVFWQEETGTGLSSTMKHWILFLQHYAVDSARMSSHYWSQLIA